MEKVVLVTGASSGIGRAIVEKLASSYEVIIHYNSSEEEALELKSKLDTLYNRDALVVKCDLAKEEEIEAQEAEEIKE